MGWLRELKGLSIEQCYFLFVAFLVTGCFIMGGMEIVFSQPATKLEQRVEKLERRVLQLETKGANKGRHDDGEETWTGKAVESGRAE